MGEQRPKAPVREDSTRRRMANARVFEELKTALMSATPGQLNSHSTLKAAETLLQCLKRDGVATGTSGYNDGGAAAHYAKLRMMNSGGGSSKSSGGGVVRSTEGIMPGSSWSEAY